MTYYFSISNKFTEVCETMLSRRGFLGGAALFIPTIASAGRAQHGIVANFASIGESNEDIVRIPEGYEWHKLVSWGDALFEGQAEAIVQDGAPFNFTRSEQEKRVGTCNDMFALFPKNYSYPWIDSPQQDWIFCSNNEYVLPYLCIAPNSSGKWLPNPTQIEALYAAQGVTIMEVTHDINNGSWTPKLCKEGEGLNRRITPFTEVIFDGAAKNHPWIEAAKLKANANEADIGNIAQNPDGVLCGTMQNCAGGFTPWGTYLTAEENIDNMFFTSDNASPALAKARNEGGFEFDENSFTYGTKWKLGGPDQFDISRNPFGPALYGWVVEIDPYDPSWTPRKRTALGRKKQECATCVITKSGQVAVYSGDDQANEFVYKFVTSGKFNPTNRLANRDLLSSGKLYVARFESNGTGRWIEITLEAANAAPKGIMDAPFLDEADLKVRNREAASRLGATQMDRPEDVECPIDGTFMGKGSVYLVCTGNVTEDGRNGNSANPRRSDGQNPELNYTGHIIRVHEKQNDHAATEFDWEIFLTGGDHTAAEANLARTDGETHNLSSWVNGHQFASGARFAMPDNITFDKAGNAWFTTDGTPDSFPCNDGIYVVSTTAPTPREVKRFLTGPVGCELTGPLLSPDNKTFFCGLQHIGEADVAGNSYRAQQDKPFSTFPNEVWPRDTIIYVRRKDGGIIGT